MSLRVAVDFGTSSTCVVASIKGREPQVVVIDGHPILPSAVYAASDGTLFVGLEAERQAAVDPSRYEPYPKRRIDEGELLLGSSIVPVREAVRAVLHRAVVEARRFAADAEVDWLVLTHPADWGVVRTRVLRQAAGNLAREVSLVPEPVAAAVFHAATVAPAEGRQAGDERTVEFSGQVGDALAVLDVGGGTVDVSVLRREPETQVNHTADGGREGFRVLATRGDPGFGGADVDQALLEHVGALVSDAGPEAWRELVEGRELAGRRRRRVLRQDVRGAKETLSRHVYTDVPLPEPFWDAHVTREDLERLIAPPFDRVVEMVSGALTDACLRPKQLTGVFLVGGSSRIPLISRLVHERIGVVPTTLDQPETVVARGAIRAVLGGPERAGASPGTKQAAPPLAQRPTSVVGPEDVPPGAGKGRGPAPQQPPAQRDPQRDPQPDPRRPRQPPPQGSPQGSSQAGPQVSPQADRPLSPPRGHQLPGAVAGPVPGTGTGRQPPSVPGTFAASAQQEQGSSRRTWPWLLGGGLGLAAIAGIGAAMLVLPGEDEEEPRRGEAATIGLHDFRFEVPSGWRQTGYDGEAQTVVVQPDDAADGDDLVAVQQFDLYRDIDDDFETFADELEQLVDEAGERYASFDREASYAGRDVIYYTEPGQQQATDWFVVAEGRVQISVGCQYTEAGLERVEQACEQVVRTLAITG